MSHSRLKHDRKCSFIRLTFFYKILEVHKSNLTRVHAHMYMTIIIFTAKSNGSIKESCCECTKPANNQLSVKSVAWRLAVNYDDQLLPGKRSHSPTSRYTSSPTPVVITEPFSDRTWSLRHVESNGGRTDNEMCDCGDIQTMSHIVDSCPLTKLDGGLQRRHLQTADEIEVNLLMSPGT